MTRITLRKEVRVLVLFGALVGYMLALTIILAVEGSWWHATALGLCCVVIATLIEQDIRKHYAARVQWREAAFHPPSAKDV